MDRWRVIVERDVDAAYGLAADEALSCSVAYNNSPPILRFYNFLPSVIVGRYQNIQAAVNLEECKRRGISYNRRHTGGGTVLMGPGQLALGFAIPLTHPGVDKSIKKFFMLVGGIISSGLAKMGITSSFYPKNDIEVKGKKIAGLAVSREEKEVFFFHMSLLLDFDIRLMLKLLNIPAQKNVDRGMSCFSQRLTTVKNELGVSFPFSTAVSLIKEAFCEEFGVELISGGFSSWEREKIQDLIDNRYSQKKWIFSVKRPHATICIQKKTPGGLLQVYLSLLKGVIENILITGDFFSTTKDVIRIESALRWTPATRKSIGKVLNKVMKDDSIHGVSTLTLTETIMEGIELCLLKEKKVQAT